MNKINIFIKNILFIEGRKSNRKKEKKKSIEAT